MANPTQHPKARSRILLYARYSTDEQNPRSTEDQFRYCRESLLADGYHDATFIELSDVGLSGELLSRPGINDVRLLVKQRQVDIVVAEDVSRFFRDRSEPAKLAGLCIDHDVRLIAIADGVDTQNLRWEDTLHHVVARYASDNEDTSRRIKRAARGRFDKEYVMYLLPPGYQKTPVDPERTAKTGRGPYLASTDPQWRSTIEQFFERAARGDKPWALADFLNRTGLPRVGNGAGKPWDDRAVKSLIRNPLYKGLEEYGRTRIRKHYGSGKHLPERVPSEQVNRRDMPHLAIVSSLVWQQANDAIDSRDRSKNHTTGAANPSFRIPRDRRGPINGHFVCGCCGGKMIGQGRNEGGYRCSNALKDECWNKATVVRDLTIRRIFGAIGDRLLALDGAAESLLEFTRQFAREGGDQAQQAARVRKRLSEVVLEMDKLAEAVVKAPDVAVLTEKLKDRQEEQQRLQADLDSLERQIEQHAEPPTSEQILSAAQQVQQSLLAADTEASMLLRQIATPIQAVPYQRIDCGLVVLRARFRLNLVALLPEQWQQVARGADVDLSEAGLLTEKIEVDLFDEPLPVQLAAKALSLSRQPPRPTGEQIAGLLGTTRHSVYEAIKLGEFLEQRGASSPYVELTERPANASRWRERSRPRAD